MNFQFLDPDTTDTNNSRDRTKSPLGDMAAVNVKVLNADFEENLHRRPDEPISVAFQAVHQKHSAFKVTSFCLNNTELDVTELVKDLATLGCIFLEAETTADSTISKIISKFQMDKPKFEPIDRHTFLKMVHERGFLEGGDILW